MGIERRWRRQAVDSLPHCERVLDVATGTADYAIAAVLRSKAERVVGIDISEGMLSVGREKVVRKNLSEKIGLMHADVAALPFEDASFDAITCGYGVRNFADLDNGLAEMHRVLRPGGQLLILEFSYPSQPLVRKLYDLFFTHLMPLVGRVVSKDPTAYIYFRDSVKGFIWGDEMLDHIRRAGFADTQFRTLTFGITTIYTANKPQ